VRLRITTIAYKAFPFTLTVIDMNDKNPICFDEEILTKHCMIGMIDYYKINEKGERASYLLNFRPIAL
jgi:hypothetical protein